MMTQYQTRVRHKYRNGTKEPWGQWRKVNTLTPWVTASIELIEMATANFKKMTFHCTTFDWQIRRKPQR